MTQAWMRILYVTLISTKLNKSMTIGFDSENSPTISIDGHKYLSPLKDSCTIEIANLSYAEIVQIIEGQYYDAYVQCGYKDSIDMTVFKGGVLYITNNNDDAESNFVTILCASDVVAKLGQSRLNLSLNSGINLYSALKFICNTSGIKNPKIDDSLRTRYINEIMSANDTTASWVDKLCDKYTGVFANTAEAFGDGIDIFDVFSSNLRVIKLAERTISMTNGKPKLSSDGLRITVMPTFNFVPGDVIQIDNSLINMSEATAYTNLGAFLDKDGQYMIFEINYKLENRGSAFSFELLCRARSLFTNFISEVSK